MSATPAVDNQLLTVEEVAATLRCRPEKVYRMCGRGEIVSLRVGGRRLIAKSDLDAYIEKQKGRRLATVTPIKARR